MLYLLVVMMSQVVIYQEFRLTQYAAEASLASRGQL